MIIIIYLSGGGLRYIIRPEESTVTLQRIDTMGEFMDCPPIPDEEVALFLKVVSGINEGIFDKRGRISYQSVMGRDDENH
mgnify:CR=1 FL=1